MTVAQHSPSDAQIRAAGRFGLVGRGALMALVGALILSLALGGGGEASPEGAISALATRPFGTVLLAALAIALVVYALWQGARAWTNPEDRGGADGALKRAVSVGRALLYLGLAALAVAQALGSGAQGNSEQGLTAALLRLPAGRVAVGGIGVAIAVFGARQAYKVLRKDAAHEFRPDLAPGLRNAMTVAARLGHLAHAIAHGAVAFFLVQAAVRYDPQQATGLDGALRRLVDEPYGPALLIVTGVGFLTFAAYCALLARYGRLVEDEE